MIDLQLCCVSIQRNKLEFRNYSIVIYSNENGSRYFIISIHSIAPLFTLHQISVMSERMRTIAVSSSFRTVFILFVCLTFLDDFSFICFYPFASFFFWIRFARAGVFISSERKQAQTFVLLLLSSFFFHVFCYSSELFTFLECDPKNVYQVTDSQAQRNMFSGSAKWETENKHTKADEEKRIENRLTNDCHDQFYDLHVLTLGICNVILICNADARSWL